MKRILLFCCTLVFFYSHVNGQCNGAAQITYNPSAGCEPQAEICPTLQGTGWVIDPMIITFPDGSTYNVNQEIAFGLPIDQTFLDAITGGVLPCISLSNVYAGDPNGQWSISVTNTGSGSLDFNLPTFDFIVDAGSCSLITIDETLTIPSQSITVAANNTNVLSFCTFTPSGFPVVDPIYFDTLCAGTSFTITGEYFIGTTDVLVGGTPVEYFQVFDDTAMSILIGPGTTGPISVVTAAGTATSPDTLVVIVAGELTVSDTSICIGDVVTLSVTGANSHVWSTGATTASISIAPSTDTTITVNVEGDYNCQAQLVQAIQVTNCSFVVSLGNNQNVCAGYVANLYPTTAFGTPPYTYSWTATGNALSCNTCSTPTATINQNSRYILTITDANSLIARDTIQYTVVACNVCSPVSSTKSGEMLPLTEDWAPVEPGQVYVQSISYRGIDTLITQGFSRLFEYIIIDSIANLPCGITWSTDQVDNRFEPGELGCILFTGTTNDPIGQYNLEIYVKAKEVAFPNEYYTDLFYLGTFSAIRVCNNPNNNCPAIDTASAGLSASCATGTIDPLFAMLTLNSNICPGYRDTLSAMVTGGVPPYSFSWSASGATLSCNNCNSVISTAQNNGNIQVVVTDAIGNTTTVTQSFTVTPVNATVYSNFIAVICEGESLEIFVGETGTYLWSNGATNPSTVVSDEGTYSVTVNMDNGCTAVGDIYVQVDSILGLQPIIGQTAIAPLQVYNYLVTMDAQYDYEWIVVGGAIQTGQYTNSVNVVWAANGPYSISLIRTNSSGCYDSTGLSNIFITGIEPNVQDLTVSVFPNPSNGSFVIDLGGLNMEGAVQLKITDIRGALVQENTIDARNMGNYDLNLINTQVGIYFLQLLDDNGQLKGVAKLVKQ